MQKTQERYSLNNKQDQVVELTKRNQKENKWKRIKQLANW